MSFAMVPLITFHLSNDNGCQYHPSLSRDLPSHPRHRLAKHHQALGGSRDHISWDTYSPISAYHCWALPLAPVFQRQQVGTHPLPDWKSQPHRTASSTVVTIPTRPLGPWSSCGHWGNTGHLGRPDTCPELPLQKEVLIYV